jgi:hypothetical protein
MRVSFSLGSDSVFDILKGLRMRKLKTFCKYSVFFSFSLLLFACANSPKQVAPDESKNETKIESKNKVPDSTAIRVSAPEIDAAEPGVAVAPDGSVYVVWVEHGAARAADVYLQKFSNEAQPAGEKVRINSPIGQATAWRGDAPTMAIGKDGAIYVGWTASVKTGKASGTDLYVSVSRDGGKTFAAPVKVNDDAEIASHGMHSLAVDGSGKIYVAWLDERNVKKPLQAKNEAAETPDANEFEYIKAHHTPTPEAKQEKEEAEPNSEIFYSVSRDGGKTFAPNKKISSEVCPCCKTSLLTTADGKVYASWRQVLAGDFRHIAVASTVDGGENFSAPAIVSDDQWQINACPVSGAALAIAENGALRVVWFTAGKAGNPGLYTAESKDGGKTFGARVLIDESTLSGAPIFLTGDDGKAGIVWESNGKLFRAKPAANQNDKFEVAEIRDGATPSAALFKDKLFVAFNRKDGDKRGVWLTAF